MKYTANAPQGFKYKLKRTVKKIVQPFRIPKKIRASYFITNFFLCRLMTNLFFMKHLPG